MSEHLLTTSYRSSQYTDVVIEEPLQRSSQQPRRVLLYFLKRNITVTLAFVIGMACVGAVVHFTSWLSKQIPSCPAWAVDCNVPERAKSMTRNFGTVQGIVTAVYSVGLAALAFAAHSFSESALWPLLHKQRLSIKQIDTYLNASRGSIPASPFVLLAARNLDAVLVVLGTILVTLSPLAAAPIIGHVYNRQNVSVDFQSETQAGGGIGPYWSQTNPPGVLRESSTSFYTSWQGNLSSEPMPDYRDWFVDRVAWSNRGSFTINSVRLQQDIDCRGWEAAPEKDKGFFWFKTDMNGDGKTRRGKDIQHDAGVFVRDVSRLSVWAHNYTFESPTKTIATIIFAAMNGTIDAGLMTSDMPKGDVKSISSIACDIAVEFIEDTMVVGNAIGPAIQINSLKQIFDPKTPVLMEGNSTAWNELLLWFAAAPVANGAYAYGAQPMYLINRGGWIPERFTSTDNGNNGGWTVDYIEKFIRVTTGASMLGEVGKWPIGEKIRVSSSVYVPKMDPTRPIYLVIVPLIIIATGSLLLVWNFKMHSSMGIPIMRTAKLSEVLKSSQTADVLGPAALDKMDATEPSSLDRLKVKFMRSETGVWGLYSQKASSLYSGKS